MTSLRAVGPPDGNGAHHPHRHAEQERDDELPDLGPWSHGDQSGARNYGEHRDEITRRHPERSLAPALPAGGVSGVPHT